MTNPVGSSSATSLPFAQDTTAAQAKDSNLSKETFLQLLVAQIKNQDPLNPAEGTEFLSQLAQFSELEQMMTMSSELKQIREFMTTPLTADEQSGAADNV